MHDAIVRFSYDRPETAATIERALRPEIDEIQGGRSSVTVDREENTLVVRIRADDPRALRASKATWFSLVQGSEGAVDAAVVRSDSA